MPRASSVKGAATSAQPFAITYAVLGLLAKKGPLSGYDLKAYFDLIIAPAWNAGHSQIYKELRRLEELGWATMTLEKQEGRPDRRVYAVSKAGLAGLRAWHERPPEQTVFRDELLLRLLYGEFAEREDLLAALKASRGYHEQRLAFYEQKVAGVDRFTALAARAAVEIEKAHLRWIDATAAALKRARRSLARSAS